MMNNIPHLYAIEQMKHRDSIYIKSMINIYTYGMMDVCS